jgi:hypothetical protein
MPLLSLRALDFSSSLSSSEKGKAPSTLPLLLTLLRLQWKSRNNVTTTVTSLKHLPVAGDFEKTTPVADGVSLVESTVSSTDEKLADTLDELHAFVDQLVPYGKRLSASLAPRISLSFYLLRCVCLSLPFISSPLPFSQC